MFITDMSILTEFILIVFSVVLLVKESPVKKANSILAITFILIAVCNFSMFFLHYCRINHLQHPLSYYFPVHFVLNMLVSPTIYCYVLRLFGSPQSPWRKNILWHALPALPAFIYILYFIQLPVQVRVIMLLNQSASTHWILAALNILFYIQSATYLICCFLKVNKHRKNNYLLKINEQHTDIRWLYYFFCFISIGLVTCMLHCSISGFNHIQNNAGLVFSDLLIIYLFIQSLWQTGVSMQYMDKTPRKMESKLIIDDQQLEIYSNQLTEAMKTSVIYLSSECTLRELAATSKIPLHHLSKLINSHQHMNFSDFINQYRVQYACHLLNDKTKQNLTLEAIGTECGFGSRSNFNRAFKKHTGQTPTEYQLQLSQVIVEKVRS